MSKVNDEAAIKTLTKAINYRGDYAYERIIKAMKSAIALLESKKQAKQIETHNGEWGEMSVVMASYKSEIVRLIAENKAKDEEIAQLKRALGHPEPDNSNKQYMFCGYCGKEGAMTIDELQQHILSCEKHPIFKLQAELKAKDDRIEELQGEVDACKAEVVDLIERIKESLKEN